MAPRTQRKGEWKESWWRRMSSDVTNPPPFPRKNSCVDISSTHINTSPQREYWMIYWGPGSLAVVWFGSSPTPPPFPVKKLDRRHTLTGRLTRGTTCWGEGGRKGVGEEPNSGPQESLVLYKSFNTLLSLTCSSCSICVSITEKIHGFELFFIKRLREGMKRWMKNMYNIVENPGTS